VTKSDFIAIAKKGAVLFDGGMGTQLQALGLAVGEAPETWNLEHPERVSQVHLAYCEAGAQIVTTNSFGASPYKLVRSGITADAYQINRRAAEIARSAITGSTGVAGSIGPTGAMLMMEEIGEAEMAQGFETQIRGLVDGGVDVLIIETMSDLQEAVIALTACKKISRLPVFCSMTFSPGQQGFRTMMGTDIATAVQTLEKHGAEVLGCNCGIGINQAVKIVQEMRQFTSLPLLAEPNAGLPKLVDGKTVYAETPTMMAEKIPALLKAGAIFVGGCCGTTPAHTSAFRDVLSRVRR